MKAKKLPEIEMRAGRRDVAILLDGIPHLMVRRADLVGVQAWIERRARAPFKIELALRDTEPMLIEYDSRALWGAVLAQLGRLFSVTPDE